MEDLLELLVPLFFVEADTPEEDAQYDFEFNLIWEVIVEAGLAYLFAEAIQWIDPTLIVTWEADDVA